MSVSTRTPRAALRSPRPWLAPTAAVGLMLLGGYLIVGASLHPARGGRPAAAARSAPTAAAPPAPRTRNIEEIRVGDRVHADAPAAAAGANPGVAASSTGAVSAADAEEVDPATWRRIEFVTADAEGGCLEITLLRPSVWAQDLGATPGRQVPLVLPEMGLDGPARVVAIGPCPPIGPGPGRVVTGTFVHDNVPVLDLRLAGSADPLGVTPGHAIWSEDRQAFVLAGELRAGERLRLQEGTTRVQAVAQRPGRHRVYNLEVQGVHVYHVTDRSLLVHNNSVEGVHAPKTGELFERTFQTSKGPVDFLAETVVDGDTLLLKDVVVYGRDPSNLTGLTKEALAARTQLVNEAIVWGFKKLRITGQRIQSSSSANPGHTIDITIDLTK